MCGTTAMPILPCDGSADTVGALPRAPAVAVEGNRETAGTAPVPFGQEDMKSRTGSARSTTRTSPIQPYMIWSIFPPYS